MRTVRAAAIWRRRAFGLGAFLLLGPTLAASEAAKPAPAASQKPPREPAPLAPRPLEAARGERSWEGFQFLAADAKGRAYRFNPVRYEATPLSGPADRREPQPLVKLTSHGTLWVRSAALAEDGASWVILGETTVARIAEGKEAELLPVPWEPQAVAVVAGDPVVLVTPQPIGTWSEKPDSREAPPLALRWTGKAWERLADAEPLSEEEQETPMKARLYRQAVALGTGRGRLWVADSYRYRLREFSPSGSLLTQIVVGDGKVQHVDEETAKKLQANLLREIKATGASDAEIARGELFVNTAKLGIVALTEGRDGRLYVLSHGEGSGLELDRYDAVTAVLERVKLALPYEGLARMAAASDGLLFGAARADQPKALTWLPWEELEEAPWKPVEDLKIRSGQVP